jgi:hypothetical protein
VVYGAADVLVGGGSRHDPLQPKAAAPFVGEF